MRSQATGASPGKTTTPPLVKTDIPGIFTRTTSKGTSFVVVYYDNDGRQRKRFAKIKTEAKRLQAELNTDVRRGEHTGSSRLTLNEYEKTWAESYRGRSGRGVRPATVAGYREDLRIHVLPVLGRRRLTTIEPIDLKALRATLERKGLAPNTIRLAFAALRVVLASAVEDRIIRVNPMSGFRLPHALRGATRRHLEPEELEGVFAALPEQWRPFFRLMEWTGARVSEFLAITWADVDLNERQIMINKRLARDGTIGPVKTSFSVRSIPLSKEWVAELRWIKIASPFSGDDDPIFCTSLGTHYSAGNITRTLKKATKAAGVGWASCHSLRHTRATTLARIFPDKRGQQWMGHATFAFFQDTYVGKSRTINIDGIDNIDTLSAKAGKQAAGE